MNVLTFFFTVAAFWIGFGFSSILNTQHYGVIISALHTQIEKQNCEENTIPRLRKELLKK